MVRVHLSPPIGHKWSPTLQLLLRICEDWQLHRKEKDNSTKKAILRRLIRRKESNFAQLCCNNRVKRVENFCRKDGRRGLAEDASTYVKKRSSYKEHTEDALVHGAEEGRGKLRKATGRSKHPAIRRYPIEGTQRTEMYVIHTWIHSVWRGTRGTETS